MSCRDGGFTLVEALVALAFVSAITAGLANLTVIAIGLVRDAHEDFSASTLAIQKIEQLRSAVATGLPVTTAPASALDEDTPGFGDLVDAGGRSVTEFSRTSTVFVRRWRVAPLPLDSSPRRLLQVRVVVARHSATVPAGDVQRPRVPGEVLLTTVAGTR